MPFWGTQIMLPNDNYVADDFAAAHSTLTALLHPREFIVKAEWARAERSVPSVVFSRPSSVGGAQVQVLERRGWRSLHTSDADVPVSIHQSTSNIRSPNDSILVTEYLLSMLAVGLTARPVSPSASEARLLFLGLGAGTLPSTLATLLGPRASLHAIELDATVADAASLVLGLDMVRVRVSIDDAARWVRRHAVAGVPATQRYTHVFVDVFGADECTPAPFYSQPFLSDLRELLDVDAAVVTNFHHSEPGAAEALDMARSSYVSVFGEGRAAMLRCLEGRNVLLCATVGPAASLTPAGGLQATGRREGRRWRVGFDAGSRLARACPF
jgi:hypothetical protein